MPRVAPLQGAYREDRQAPHVLVLSENSADVA